MYVCEIPTLLYTLQPEKGTSFGRSLPVYNSEVHYSTPLPWGSSAPESETLIYHIVKILIEKYSPTESKNIPELVTIPSFKDKHGQRNGCTRMSCNGYNKSRKNKLTDLPQMIYNSLQCQM